MPMLVPDHQTVLIHVLLSGELLRIGGCWNWDMQDYFKCKEHSMNESTGNTSVLITRLIIDIALKKKQCTS